VPLIVLAGAIDDNIEAAAFDAGVSAIFCINRRFEDFARPEICARSNLALTMDNILRFQKMNIIPEKH